jgi:hypothetical protein
VSRFPGSCQIRKLGRELLHMASREPGRTAAREGYPMIPGGIDDSPLISGVMQAHAHASSPATTLPIRNVHPPLLVRN